jgi:hypothetical protein
MSSRFAVGGGMATMVLLAIDHFVGDGVRSHIEKPTLPSIEINELEGGTVENPWFLHIFSSITSPT